ncbi:MAG: hypothetical protein ACI80V_003883, partial [Rhodothermales bacterium]
MVPRRAAASITHPEPRLDIDSSLVLDGEQLEGASKKVKEIFGMIREIPQIADG